MELKCPQFAPVRSKTEAEGYRPSAWHNSLTRRPDGSRRYRCHGSSRPAGPGHLDADPNPAPPSDAPGKLNGYDVHSPEHVARRVPGNTGFQFNPDAIPADTCRHASAQDLQTGHRSQPISLESSASASVIV